MKRPPMQKQLPPQGTTDEPNTVFLVSPFVEDHILLAQIFKGLNWRVSGVSRCAEAREILLARRSAVVICEWELPDGDWKEILDALGLLPFPPPLLVTSWLADERRWGLVLHLGGYDLLAKPLDRMEVLWAVNTALQQHHRQMESATRAKSAAAATMQ